MGADSPGIECRPANGPGAAHVGGRLSTEFLTICLRIPDAPLTLRALRAGPDGGAPRTQVLRRMSAFRTKERSGRLASSGAGDPNFSRSWPRGNRCIAPPQARTDPTDRGPTPAGIAGGGVRSDVVSQHALYPLESPHEVIARARSKVRFQATCRSGVGRYR